MLVSVATAVASVAGAHEPPATASMAIDAPTTASLFPAATVTVRSLPLQIDSLPPSAFADWIGGERPHAD